MKIKWYWITGTMKIIGFALLIIPFRVSNNNHWLLIAAGAALVFGANGFILGMDYAKRHYNGSNE